MVFTLTAWNGHLKMEKYYVSTSYVQLSQQRNIAGMGLFRNVHMFLRHVVTRWREDSE